MSVMFSPHLEETVNKTKEDYTGIFPVWFQQPHTIRASEIQRTIFHWGSLGLARRLGTGPAGANSSSKTAEQ